MKAKSDIYIYEVYSTDPIPVKEILRILKPVLLNYSIRDKRFMWVNLREPITDALRTKVTDLHKDIFCLRFSLYSAHIIT